MKKAVFVFVIVIVMCVSMVFAAGKADPNQIKKTDPNHVQKVVRLDKVAINQQLKAAGTSVQLTDTQVAKLNANPQMAAKFQHEINRTNKQIQKSQRRLSLMTDKLAK